MRILFISHTDPFGPFRVGSHHLSRELARAGHDVVHLSTPISLAHLLTGRVRWTKFVRTPSRSFVEGVRTIVPKAVLPAGVGRYGIARTLRRYGLRDFDVALIDQPLMWSPSISTIARTLVYRPTDEYPHGIKSRRQTEILESADAVVATSDEVLRALGAIDLPRLVIENGVDCARFQSRATNDRPRNCVYVGAFDKRFDWDQVIRWAEESPEWGFRMIGPVEARPAQLPSNIAMVGPIDYEHLPAQLASARVGLLPLSSDALNRARSPMKLYEYLSSGLAVVSRETPVIRPQPEAGIHTYTDPRTASRAIRVAMDQPTPNTAGSVLAEEHSWTVKARTLLEFVAALSPR